MIAFFARAAFFALMPHFERNGNWYTRYYLHTSRV